MKNSLLVLTKKIAKQLLFISGKNDFSGRDPFDGINSQFFTLLPKLKITIFGLVWIQFCKLSPIDFRPILLVPKGRNPKGVGLFILGMIEDYKRTNNISYIHQATELADWLLTQQCSVADWQHSCWGYHFDWKARAFFVPKGKPNVITTVYVSRALFELANVLQGNGEINKAKVYRQPAIDAGHFIVKTLYTEADDRCFFAYIPDEKAFVHNASLWAAAWVAVVAEYTDNQKYRNLALTVARQSAYEQQKDGAWVYGARHHHQFIDGFHTGYNLEALDLIRSTLNVDEFDQAIKKGFKYYKSHFFEEDGTAKYYNKNRYPLDMHSVSQAILTITKLTGCDDDKKGDAELVERVVKHSINALYLPDKQHFVYQKNKYFTNKINYMRWTQAWVYYSFSFYNRYISEK